MVYHAPYTASPIQDFGCAIQMCGVAAPLDRTVQRGADDQYREAVMFTTMANRIGNDSLLCSSWKSTYVIACVWPKRTAFDRMLCILCVSESFWLSTATM